MVPSRDPCSADAEGSAEPFEELIEGGHHVDLGQQVLHLQAVHHGDELLRGGGEVRVRADLAGVAGGGELVGEVPGDFLIPRDEELVRRMVRVGGLRGHGHEQLDQARHGGVAGDQLPQVIQESEALLSRAALPGNSLAVLEDREEQLLLAVEVVHHAGVGEPDPVGDLAHGPAAIAKAAEHLEGYLEDLGSPGRGLGVRPARSAGACWCAHFSQPRRIPSKNLDSARFWGYGKRKT